jgi:hypothetical protein
MATPVTFDEVLELALQLSEADRKRLAESVTSTTATTPTSVRDAGSAADDWESQPWTDEELAALLNRPRPQLSGAEIVAQFESKLPIALVDPEISDPVEWVKAQRQKVFRSR